MGPATAVAWQHTTTAVGLGAAALRPFPGTAVPVALPCDRSRSGVADAFHYFKVHPATFGHVADDGQKQVSCHEDDPRGRLGT